MKNIITIDFSRLGGPLYSGRNRGEQARKINNLDIVDQSDTVANIEIPESTYSITSSFFLGLFGKSIRSCGNTEIFFEKFRFKAPDRMMDKFVDYVNRALREKKPLI